MRDLRGDHGVFLTVRGQHMTGFTLVRCAP